MSTTSIAISKETKETAVKRFQEKYPFIECESFRSGQEKVAIKILAETQAKRHVFDVVTSTLSRR
jgi:predicted secreted Zn-dependent protease